MLITKEELQDLYVLKWQSPSQIAKEYGVAPGTISYWLVAYNIPRHGHRIRGMDKETLEDLYIQKKWSTIRIADHFKCKTDETVRKALQRNGIPLRTKSEAGAVKIMTPEHKQKLRENAAKVNKGKIGPLNHAWKGGRYIDSYGYVIRRIDGEVVKEHRYVMQQKLSRKLKPWEEVNHINGIRTDNREENLEVIYSEHKHKDWLRRNSTP